MAHGTLRTVTLGCKVNQWETEWVRQALVGSGYRDALDGDAADLCIVNTCTVTAEGDAKSRQVVRRLARENPAARIVVMGCYATRAPDELRQLPGVTEVVTDKRELPDLLGRAGVSDVPEGISSFGTRQRAYVKVQDGCLLRCSFCIIPHVRPQMTSRPLDEIDAEVQRLVASGHREIVLTGIHLGHYGVDRNRGLTKSQWLRLSHLVERLADRPGRFRVRLSSIEATEVTRELIAVLAARPERVCPHLHVSMQSGSDAVLRRMRRRWGSQRIIERCLLVRESLDRPALTSDVIVGFPGETDADFEATCRVVEQVGFAKIHIFPFSPRRGTPAASLERQVPPEVKRQRAAHLAALGAKLRTRYLEQLVGRRLELLVEGRDERDASLHAGTTCRYMPAVVPADSVAIGELASVVADRVEGGRMVTRAVRGQGV